MDGLRFTGLAVGGVAAVIVLVACVFTVHRPFSGLPRNPVGTPEAARQRASEPHYVPPMPGEAPPSAEPSGGFREKKLPSPLAGIGSEIAAAARVILTGLLGAGALLAVLAASRLRARRGREMQRFLITPGRSSEASPAQVAGLIEALGAIARERWWVRLWRGTPPAAALEIVAGVHPGGTREQRLGIAVPKGEGSVEALRGALATRYPDATLTELGADAPEALRGWLTEVVRLKKEKPFTKALDRPYEPNRTGGDSYVDTPIDALLSVMAESSERVLVQIVITPATKRLQRVARGFAIGRREAAREPAGSDAVKQREERASTDAVVFRPLHFCELRVGAQSYGAARRVAGAIQGIAEGGENRLSQRRAVLRRRLYVKRMANAESNPLPSWWHGVYSSLEIAGIWQVPTPYAKNVAIRRTSIPQLATPPEVFKPTEPGKAIARDLRDKYVGIRSEDFKYGVQVSGVQGGGKTSLLARIAEVRARETNTAVIVLDPKDELAEAALASMPSWRDVWYLDVARPLFGMALRTPDRDLQAEASIFSEAMVDVSRTEEGDSQALNASQRSFKMARGATLALEEEPTFWHTARWLASDDEAEEWRAEKIRKLAGDAHWHNVWDHFARILPAQLKKSPAQAVMRLEAPYNKIQTLLGDERLSTVLHHPVTVSFDEVIRRRQVLIVAARVPDHPDGAVLLKFFMQLIHRAIMAQQKLPEDERARVAVIGDDAGHLFSPTIAKMMEHDRSSGLDIALGWQHGGQMTPELAQAIDALANSRFYLRSAQADAERAVNRLNPTFVDRRSGDLAELQRARVEVNQLTNLDVNHAIAVLQAGKQLSSSFTVQTIPWHRDPEKVEAFEKRVRDQGGYDPEQIAPPAELTGRAQNEKVDDVGGEADGEPVAEASERPKGPGKPEEAEKPSEETRGEQKAEEEKDDEEKRPSAPAPAPAPEPARKQPKPERPAPEPARKGTPPRRGRREAEVAELGTPTDKPLSEGYREIELLREKAAGISWSKPASEPVELSHNALNAEQRSVLEALYELQVLSGGQIHRDLMISASERQLRRELSLLIRLRMIRRGELRLQNVQGRGKRFYVLDNAGFEYLRQASEHEAAGNWRRYEPDSAQHVVHNLTRNEWLFAFRSLAPRQLVSWHGTRAGKIEVPLVKERRERARRMTVTDLGAKAPVDFGGEEFTNVIPDLTLEVLLTKPKGEQVNVDLLVEIEWSNNDATVERKAIAYDALITGWWQALPRYKNLGRPPILFFVVPDAKRAARFIEILDRRLTSYLVGAAQTQTREQREQGITPEAEKFYFGRRNIFVAVARDIHQRTLRAHRVPAEPPEVRIRNARNAAERRTAGRPVPRAFMLINPRQQVNPAS